MSFPCPTCGQKLRQPTPELIAMKMDMPPKVATIFLYMMRHQGMLCSIDELITALYAEGSRSGLPPDKSNIMTLVTRLRKKLPERHFIRFDRKQQGYVLEVVQ